MLQGLHEGDVIGRDHDCKACPILALSAQSCEPPAFDRGTVFFPRREAQVGREQPRAWNMFKGTIDLPQKLGGRHVRWRGDPTMDHEVFLGFVAFVLHVFVAETGSTEDHHAFGM